MGVRGFAFGVRRYQGWAFGFGVIGVARVRFGVMGFAVRGFGF